VSPLYHGARSGRVSLRELRGSLLRPSLRDISAALAAEGFTTPKGKPYSASAVASMIGQ
jgi:hypothetical protein